MQANVGMLDKIVRGLGGLALIGWAAMDGSSWAWLGVVPLASAIFGWCPFYALFGTSSCGSEDA